MNKNWRPAEERYERQMAEKCAEIASMNRAERRLNGIRQRGAAWYRERSAKAFADADRVHAERIAHAAWYLEYRAKRDA